MSWTARQAGGRGALPCLLCVALGGCLLPSFEKVDGDASMDEGRDLPGSACGISDQLPVSCDACIRENCCKLAEECGSGTRCGRELQDRPLTPLSDVSEDFEPLLGCLQQECDAACDISWGCVGEYEWPEPGTKDYSFTIKSVDFAAEPDKALPGVEIKACQAVDQSCTTGLVDTAVTNDDGLALMSVPARFDGYYVFSSVETYVPTIVRWTEPVHRVDGFTHYGLTSAGVRALGKVTGELSDRDNFPADAGFLIFRAQNCLPVRFITEPDYPTGDAAGVMVEFEPSEGASRVYYTDESTIPVPSLTETTRDGLGGAFEVPLQAIDVKAYRTDTMELIGEGRVRVDAGTIGFLYIMPLSR